MKGTFYPDSGRPRTAGETLKALRLPHKGESPVHRPVSPGKMWMTPE